MTLEPGDLLCIYSDGITEAAPPDDEEFGMDRLIDLLRVERDRPLAELVEAIGPRGRRVLPGAAPRGTTRRWCCCGGRTLLESPA